MDWGPTGLGAYSPGSLQLDSARATDLGFTSPAGAYRLPRSNDLRPGQPLTALGAYSLGADSLGTSSLGAYSASNNRLEILTTTHDRRWGETTGRWGKPLAAGGNHWPSDGVSKNHSRKCCAFYWSFAEFGMHALGHEEEVWGTICCYKEQRASAARKRNAGWRRSACSRYYDEMRIVGRRSENNDVLELFYVLGGNTFESCYDGKYFAGNKCESC